MKFTEIDEGKTGLWANIHAKRERIKHGSGEKMRKPGSKGSPSAQNFKDASKTDESSLNEKWSQKYKSSINCSHPKGFSQKAHCAGKNKQNESVEMEMTCPDCGMCKSHGNLNEIKKGQKDSNGFTKCWPGKHAEGTKKGKNGGQVRNCVPNESQGVAEGSQRVDSLVTDALKIMKGPEIRDAILALKTVLGDREYNDRRGFYNFYVKQILDMYGQQGLAEAKDPWKDYEFIHNGQKIGHIYSQTGQPPFTTRRKVGKFIKQMKHNSLKDAQTYLINRSLGRPMYQDMSIDEDWQKVNKSDKTDGMSSKAVKSYRRENPGSKLKTAVTTKPSKLKKGSKAANRRKSFCARMGGMKKAHASAKTKRDPDSPINKALRRWNCESIQQMQELVMIAEQKIRNLKK